MKIIVCVKDVPDTESNIRITHDGKGIEQESVTFILNPYDEFAVEEALRIKESIGGEVTALTLGLQSAERVLRACFGLGVDNGILIRDDSFTNDPFLTASAIASYLKNISFDILLFGKKGVDLNYGQVGVMTAEILGIPSVSAITKLEIGESKVLCHREAEGNVEKLEVPLPAAFTAEKGLNEPRYPSLKLKMQAKKKEIQVVEAQKTDSRINLVKMEYPPKRPEGKIIEDNPEAASKLVDFLHNEAKVF
ncbi:MAG TPA: electron transfer flavoprotein subunit beta/FixA family protein [Nitrospinota bacterium]|nr:electron transfer flavoprotein subunit beta/FixA family protein [Nitrospinota bacterium]